MTDKNTDVPADETESPLGSLTLNQCIEELEAANQRLTENPDWGFNDEQVATLRHGTGPQLVTAGPGTGKSTVTVGQVIKWMLVDGVRPEAILLSTFTEKAARSLEQRLESWLVELGYADSIAYERVWVGTLHQLCAEVMREFRYEGYQNVELLNADAQEMFVSQKCGDYIGTLADGDVSAFDQGRANDDGGCSRATATSVATTLFNRLSQYRVDIDALANSTNGAHRRLADGYTRYLDALDEHSRCDFARLQERFLDFLQTDAGTRFVQGDPDRDHPGTQRIAVDEYQDVNPLQQEVYFGITERMTTPTLVVCGDDDQALYRFRGGTVDCLIKFPERIADRLGIDEAAVAQENLRVNYRSRPGIVDWSNRHIGEAPVMQAPGARAAGKQPLEAFRNPTPDPSVYLERADTKHKAAEAFAEQVERLHAEGYIDDYNQVALLAHSTREVWSQFDNSETFVGACVRALENLGIPAFNPRNKGFVEQEEVQLMLAALTRCVDPDGQWAETNVHPYGHFGDTVQKWDTELEAAFADDSVDTADLEAVIGRIQNVVRNAPQDSVLDLTLIDIYNKLRAQDPFSRWTGADGDVARTKRLGKLSQLVEDFEGIASGVTNARNLIRTSRDEFETTSTRFLGDFYWTFLQYLNNVDLDDPEDPYAGTPAGHVRVLTVHQAKGLEFPVVYVASLDRTADKVVTYEDDTKTTPAPTIADVLAPYCERTPNTDTETRAERDLFRQFYVAHSRAKEKLVLLGAEYYLRPANGQDVIPSLGADSGVPLTEEWFGDDQRLDKGASLFRPGTSVGPASSDASKRTYSVVGDALAFERCIRQYGFLVEYEFAASSSTQLFAGLAVHQTLDWAHRYYNGDVDGAVGGTPPTTKELNKEFESVVDSLRDQRILPMSNNAIEAVFKHVARFNENVGPTLYPQIVDTECRLRTTAGDFILTGVADVVADENDERTLVDYKATKRPEAGHKYLEDYHEQLLVYAGLYYEQKGEYPESAVLYFINEDDPEGTRYEVEFTASEVADAMDSFEQTIHRIETTRETNGWSNLDPNDLPDIATCDECPVRHDCEARDYDSY